MQIKDKNYLKNSKEYFSINLNGGLFNGKGNLNISDIPLKVLNIFLYNQKDFRGGLDFKLDYDVDKKYFNTEISSKNTFFNNLGLNLEKSKIEYNKKNKSRFDLDLSLFLK